jgi:uncharacterized protein YbjT (DUF2867 family)
MVSPEGLIAGPAGDGRAAVVARRDVAEAAAALLLGDGHDGGVYDITGREALSFAEIAALTGAAYKDETLEEAWASRSVYGAPDWQVEAWITTYTSVAAGDLDAVSDTVERFTDRKPLTLADVVTPGGDRPPRG